jgi:hypothetical protein
VVAISCQLLPVAASGCQRLLANDSQRLPGAASAWLTEIASGCPAVSNVKTPMYVYKEFHRFSLQKSLHLYGHMTEKCSLCSIVHF